MSVTYGNVIDRRISECRDRAEETVQSLPNSAELMRDNPSRYDDMVDVYFLRYLKKERIYGAWVRKVLGRR